MRIAILTGAGISRESGLATFRDSGGLWDGRRPEDVATPEAFAEDPALVQRFYDTRRREAALAEPNAAHVALAALEDHVDHVTIITQNVDDLHERAGSSDVIHIHGELASAWCLDCGRRCPWHRDLADGPPCPTCGGRALRPDIVWFGEPVYRMDEVVPAVEECDLLAVIGTSGVVYPAAALSPYARSHGATTVLLNMETHPDERDYGDVRIGPATVVVPEWVEAIRRSRT